MEKPVSEQEYIAAFAQQISVLRTKEILQYGLLPQRKNIAFTDHSLIHVPSQTNAKICSDLNKLLAQLDEVMKACQNRSWPQTNKTLLSKTSHVMNDTTKRMEMHISSLMYHMEQLEKFYEENQKIIHEFDMYIAAGELCLQRTMDEEIPVQRQKVEENGLQEDRLLLKDYEDGYALLQKKVDSLRISQQIPFQTAVHIRTVQQIEAQMIESLRTLLSNTFPIWKSTVAFSQGVVGNLEYPTASDVYEASKLLSDTLVNLLALYHEQKNP